MWLKIIAKYKIFLVWPKTSLVSENSFHFSILNFSFLDHYWTIIGPPLDHHQASTEPLLDHNWAIPDHHWAALDYCRATPRPPWNYHWATLETPPSHPQTTTKPPLDYHWATPHYKKSAILDGFKPSRTNQFPMVYSGRFKIVQNIMSGKLILDGFAQTV
jgi:hypothetical protein